MADRCYKCGRELLSTADFNGLCVYCRYEPSIPSPSPSEPTCPNCKAMREALYSAQNLLDSHGYNKKNSKVMREIDQALRGGTR